MVTRRQQLLKVHDVSKLHGPTECQHFSVTHRICESLRRQIYSQKSSHREVGALVAMVRARMCPPVSTHAPFQGDRNS